jgi:ketopantoate reductase
MIRITGQTPLAERLSAALHKQREAASPEVVLLAGYAWQTAAVVTELRASTPLDGVPPTIVCLQMGRGSRQTIDALFGTGHALVGLVLGDERLMLAEDHPQTDAVSALMTAAGFTVTHAHANSIEWSSVFWGIQGNAISAILDIAPEQIYDAPALFAIEHAQLVEAYGIIRQTGTPLIRLPGVNVPAMARQLGWIPRRWAARFLRKHPRPPSLRDELTQKSGRSDAAYLNGAIALRADEANLRAPVNHALALIVTDIAEGRAMWSQYQQNPALLEATIRLAR